MSYGGIFKMKFVGFDGEIEIENNAIKIKKGKKI